MTRLEPAAGFADFNDDFRIPVVTVSSASPFERGVQHGSQAERQIAASIDYYAHLFEINHSLAWTDVTDRAMVWAKVIEDYDADLFEEIRGISQGAGREIGEILALNARGEMVYTDFLADGCTSFALMAEASASAHTFAGQNWDWRIGAADSRIVLRIEQPPKPTLTMLVEAGQLGRHGVNSEGVSIFANGLPTSRTEVAVPQAAIRRRVLDHARFDQALHVAMSSRNQIPANLIVAHRDFAIDVEKTREESRWAYPSDGIITHANHFEYFKGAEYSELGLGVDTLYRGYLLREGLRRAKNATTDEAVLDIIASSLANTFGQPNGIAVHPDPEQPEHLRWATLSSTIVDLTAGAWYIADGAPDARPYRRLPWDLYERRV